MDHSAINLAREKVPWTADVWQRIDHAVAGETHRSSVSPRFLPHHRVAHHATNIESDVVLLNLTSNAVYTPQLQRLAANTPPPLLNVSESAQQPVVELSITVAMSQSQIHKESEHAARHPVAQAHQAMPAGHEQHSRHHPKHHAASTFEMLVRRATNVLCLARDAVVMLGANAVNLPLFTSQTVNIRGTPLDNGLTCMGASSLLPALPAGQVLTVQPSNGGGAAALAQYSQNTFGAIAAAYAGLSGSGYSGPFAAVVYSFDYADSFAPLQNTLVTPADKIKGLMDAGYHTSASLPGIANPQTGNAAPVLGLQAGLLTNANAQAVGLVMSTGGSVAQFVNGLDPVVAFSYIDPNGNYVFRVVTRFSTKISDFGAIYRLEFM